jgi:hypothetical protein
MLIVSLLLSVVLVTIAYLDFKSRRSAVASSLVSTILVTLSAVLLTCVMPGLWLHSVAVLIGAFLWKARQWSAASFLRYMIYAAAPCYAVSLFFAVGQATKRSELVERNAFESMEDRVPAPRKSDQIALSTATKKHLGDLETRLAGETNNMRVLMLKRLHESSIATFINSPGFGAVRRIEPNEMTLRIWNRDELPIPQPGPIFSLPLSEKDVGEPTKDIDTVPLREMHLNGIVDFVNPQGFGWIESRQKVAGFRPHQFSAVPHTQRLKVRTVELVGILMHDSPVVYISDKLPSMQAARNAPTRSLSPFEAVGLEKLQKGEDLFVSETVEGVHLLGALRSVEQCIKCHGGERGDLLGAFSYNLLRLP